MANEKEVIENLMRCLRISEEEARDVIKADKAIDKGEKLFELTDEQKRATRQYRQAERKPTVYDFSKRERKKDNDKRFLIAAFEWALTTDVEQPGDNVNAEDVTVTNPEREITFTYNGRKFKLTLSAPRS